MRGTARLRSSMLKTEWDESSVCSSSHSLRHGEVPKKEQQEDVQLCLDTFRRRNRQQTLRHACREPGQCRLWTRNFALSVGEELSILLERDKSWSRSCQHQS